jgi:hypothetical protein
MLLFSSPWLNRRSRERQRKVAKRMRTDFPNPFAALPLLLLLLLLLLYSTYSA